MKIYNIIHVRGRERLVKDKLFRVKYLSRIDRSI